MQCQRKKRDGKQCGAQARTGNKFCALHDEPGKAAELGSRGGRRRTVYNPSNLKEFAAPKSAPDLLALLALLKRGAGNWIPSLQTRSHTWGLAFCELSRSLTWKPD
jgi:hypothetical protein